MLAEEAAHHVSRILRLRSGNALILFDGRGGEYDTVLSRVDKRCVEVCINQYRELDNESPLLITLAQGMSRRQKMDFTLQKAIELGVVKIVPIMTDYNNVRIEQGCLQKKLSIGKRLLSVHANNPVATKSLNLCHY